MGDRWAAVLGVTVAFWSMMGILGLWLSKLTGYGNNTSLLFVIGAAAPTLVLTVGTINMFMNSLRSNKE
jgi:hypothetical protein